MPPTDDRPRERLAAQGPGKWADIAAAPARGVEPRRPSSRWARGLFALAFLAMGGFLLGSFLSSSQVPFWYESCLVLGLGAALLCLALYAWVRSLAIAHLVNLCLAVGTAGLVGSFLDSGRTSYVMPTILGFLVVTAGWYLVLFLRRRG